MPVITIRGHLGSGAPEIGKLIARKLQLDYVDREIIAKVAELLNTRKQEIIEKEMPPGTILGRIAESLTRGFAGSGSAAAMHGGIYLPAWEIPMSDTHFLEGLEPIIKELAESNSIVIRGRGSQFILKEHPGAFHVLTVAPIEVRIKRVMENLKLDEEDANKEIIKFDNSRHEFIKRYFQSELEDPTNYDIVINTAGISYKDAAAIVIKALKSKVKADQ